MTQEENLLFKDLCTRLPYGVVCHANKINIDGELLFVNKLYNIAALYYDNAIGKFESCPINDIKPYLHPMSSMTSDEFEEFTDIVEHVSIGKLQINIANPEAFDWLNAHHFDYRGLIPKGLALEAPEGIYK